MFVTYLSDHLDGNLAAPFHVPALHHTPERAEANVAEHLVPVSDHVAFLALRRKEQKQTQEKTHNRRVGWASYKKITFGRASVNRKKVTSANTT